MTAMFLWWVALLIVLAMAAFVDYSNKLRLWGLLGFVATLWIFWGALGVELVADYKWPQSASSSHISEQPVDAGQSSGECSLCPSKESDKPQSPTERLGQVGDLFGGVNALFAALACAGVAIAAWHQAKSTEIASKQAIDAPFFSALELHHRIVDGLRFSNVIMRSAYSHALRTEIQARYGRPGSDVPDAVASGRGVFAKVLESLGADRDGLTGYSATKANYQHLQNGHNYVLGHYFRSLYQILKLVDEDVALGEVEKRKYASILRAQLGSEELALLMVNCSEGMVDEGQFLTLVVRYRMLEHLPLRVEGGQYIWNVDSSSVDIVLADDQSIGQYLQESVHKTVRKRYHGAFGSNPGIS